MGEPAAERRELIVGMRRLSAELDRLGHAFGKQHGLHPTDVKALFLIMEATIGGGSINPGELARQLGLTTAAVTALLDRLERAEHVRRDTDGVDRRRVVLAVGADAMALGASFFGPLNGRLVGAMEDYQPAEIAAISRFLSDMTREISGYREENQRSRPET